tara:strand:- start:413 stop:1021 length:609 start_codon:yes stop_codon:yes gene_type:complete
MFNLKYLYDQHSTRLQIEGFPDFSVGDTDNTIGIITSWKLKIASNPELEGKKDHLIKLIDIIYTYSRYYIIGIEKRIGDSKSQVSINHTVKGHELTLRSSKEEIKPLTIILDDAELVDLITCIDKFRNDKRIRIASQLSFKNLIRNKLNTKRLIDIYKLIPSILGLSTIVLFSTLFILFSDTNRFEELKGLENHSTLNHLSR